jgi:hypothetical protein
MRRLSVVIALLMGFFLVAAAPGVAGPPKDFITGGGQVYTDNNPLLGTDAFQFSAHSTGEYTAKGNVSFNGVEGLFATLRMKAEVTCLLVFGNDAYATATITSSDIGGGWSVGNMIVAHGRDVADGPDEIRFSFEPFIYEFGNTGCYLPLLQPVPVRAGNVVVNDASLN